MDVFHKARSPRILKALLDPKALALAALCATGNSKAEQENERLTGNSLPLKLELKEATRSDLNLPSSYVSFNAQGLSRINQLTMPPQFERAKTEELLHTQGQVPEVPARLEPSERQFPQIEFELLGAAALFGLALFRVYPTRLSIYHNAPDLCDGRAMHHPSHGERSFIELFGLDPRSLTLVGSAFFRAYFHPNLPIMFFGSEEGAAHVFKELRKQVSADFDASDGLKTYHENSLARAARALYTERELQQLEERAQKARDALKLEGRTSASKNLNPFRLLLTFTNEKNELSQPRLLLTTPLDVFNCLNDLKGWANAAGFDVAHGSRAEKLRLLRSVEIAVLYLYQATPYIKALAEEDVLHAPILSAAKSDGRWDRYVANAERVARDLLPIAALACDKSLDFLTAYLERRAPQELQEIIGCNEDDQKRLILSTLYIKDERDTALSELEAIHEEKKERFRALATIPSQQSEPNSNFFSVINLDRVNLK